MDDYLSEDSQGRFFLKERQLRVILKRITIEGNFCKDDHKG